MTDQQPTSIIPTIHKGTTDSDRRFLTTKQVAERLACDEDTVCRIIELRQLQALVLIRGAKRKSYRIRPEWLDDYERRNTLTVEPGDQPQRSPKPATPPTPPLPEKPAPRRSRGRPGKGTLKADDLLLSDRRSRSHSGSPATRRAS